MRILTEELQRQFESLHETSLALLALTPDELLYRPLREPRFGTYPPSIGEMLLRSAGAVEQTCGGITVNLWDDPFEWTLPEALSTTVAVKSYFGEVGDAVSRAFGFLRTDEELSREISVPGDRTETLFNVILTTMRRASNFQGRAFTIFRLFSDTKLPRFQDV